MEMIRKFITEPFDIVLSPTTTSQFIVHTSYLNNYGINITRSNYIDFLDMSSILSTNRLALRPLLQCFRCFDSNIWTLILLSIVLVSLTSSLRQQSFRSLYEYMWNYSITLLKVNFQIDLPDRFDSNLYFDLILPKFDLWIPVDIYMNGNIENETINLIIFVKI